MSYRDESFLKEHIQSIINFYHPTCLDQERGGYINQLTDDGTIYDRDTKHLVGTCRFIYNYSIASIELNNPEYKNAAAHGFAFLKIITVRTTVDMFGYLGLMVWKMEPVIVMVMPSFYWHVPVQRKPVLMEQRPLLLRLMICWRNDFGNQLPASMSMKLRQETGQRLMVIVGRMQHAHVRSHVVSI